MKKHFILLILLSSIIFVNAQNVGIGTSNPLQKLHVIGNTYFNGNVGIGNSVPSFPLSFSQALGDKLCLWTDYLSPTYYGFGIQSGLLQIFCKTSGDAIGFGYGNSTSFTEAMRIYGNGNVGIGTSYPTYQLDIANRMRIRSGGNSTNSAGLWLNNNDNAEAAFIGMEDDTHVGLFGSGIGWKFGMNTQTGALKINGTEGTAGQVLVANASGAPSWANALPKIYSATMPADFTWAPFTGYITDLPGLTKTITLTQPSTVNISVMIFHSITNCFNCGAQSREFRLIRNGGAVYDVEVFDLGETRNTSLPNYSEQLSAGTYTYKIGVTRVWDNYSIKYSGDPSGVYKSYMTIQVFPN